ncbi:MAG: hypothetical protein Q8N47_15720 [Bryobacterales bacterium]|nr:hypothetical protein [Bryobacterales bacterium]
MRTTLGLGVLAACAWVFQPSPGWAQAPKSAAVAVPSPSIVTVDQPDAPRTRDQLSRLLERYPPSLRGVLALDSSLLGNPSYLAPYPALVGFLNAHPEIAHNPSFYVGGGPGPHYPQNRPSQVAELWRNVMQVLAVFAGFGMAIGLLVWLIRTFVDYRRWSRLAKVQTDVHTKLLDRFAAHDDLLAYIQSPAGSKFLESAPIKLDAGPRSVGAPLGRILWSVQGGLVLLSGGIGFLFLSGRVADEAAQPLHVLGVLGVALGLGFVVSAIISFVISRRLGLIELAPPAPRVEPPGD